MTLKHTFKHSRGVVDYTTGTTCGFDPTVYEVITITRNDAVEFTLNQFWSWRLSGGKDDLVVEKHADVERWLKKHSLPSLRWIEQQVEELNRSYDEDPMGSPSQYI